MNRSELRVCTALLRRDFVVLRAGLRTDIIDGSISLATQYLLYCLVFPSLGMPAAAVAAFFWGNVVFIILNTLYEQTMRASTDITFYRRVSYFTTLPMSMRLFVARTLVVGVAEMVCATIPIMVGGPFLFARYLSWQPMRLPLFFLVYVSALWFSAAFALIWGFKQKFQWVRDNIWLRVIMPLAYLSPIYYSFAGVWGLSSLLGILFLLNPYTYVVEGFRSATALSLLNPLLCSGVLLMAALCASWYAYRVIIARLDAVIVEGE